MIWQKEHTHEWIKLEFEAALKTYSSAVVGGGADWKRLFVNRFVTKDYDCSDPIAEMEEYLARRGVNPTETAGMITAVHMEDAVFIEHEEKTFSLLVMVTAGVGNAVDASRAHLRRFHPPSVGTINIWVFVDGMLSEGAFIHGMVTATEAKVKALFDHHVLDPETQSLATGTSTDSILIAATQRGEQFPYAGTITPLGKAIAKTVYEGITLALGTTK